MDKRTRGHLRKLTQCKYLGGKCVISGTDYGRWAGSLGFLTNHHINAARKAEDYENIVRRNCSLAVLEELDKCALMRSDLHQTLEDQKVRGLIKFSSGLALPIHSGIIDPKMEFGVFAHLFLDMADVTRLVPRVFIVQNGDKEVAMDENQICNTFLENVDALPPGKTLRIKDKALVLLTVEKIDAEHVRLSVDSRFDIFKWEFRTRDNSYAFSRGKVIDKRWNILADSNFTLTMPITLAKRRG